MNNPSYGIKIPNHSCYLKYLSYNEKTNPGYSGGFSCNMCRKTYKKEIDCFHCSKCEYDICDKCLYEEIDNQLKNINRL